MMTKKIWSVIAVAMITSISLLAGCSGKEEKKDAAHEFQGSTLSMLIWEGYADPSFTALFEKQYGVKIKASYVTSDDDLLAKIKAGGGDAYDIVTPNGTMAGFLMESGITEPIDTSLIPNFKDISPRLILPDMKKDGKIYGVPYMWGPNYLIYDGDVFAEAPKSWSVLWDSTYKGKVGMWDDISNIYIVGEMMGLDKKDPGALYNMTEEQLATARKKLMELNSSVRKYWVSAGEVNDLFANKEIVISMGWPLTIRAVNEKGRHLKWTIPEEGTTGWVDRFMIVKGSKNQKLASLYINFIIGAEGQALTAKVTNYSVVNPKAAEFMSPELQKMTYVHEMDSLFVKLNFWQYVANRARYNEIWTEVKTGK
jgi:spermidine/putrescine-binding protein